jgi:hypothetical protein
MNWLIVPPCCRFLSVLSLDHSIKTGRHLTCPCPMIWLTLCYGEAAGRVGRPPVMFLVLLCLLECSAAEPLFVFYPWFSSPGAGRGQRILTIFSLLGAWESGLVAPVLSHYTCSPLQSTHLFNSANPCMPFSLPGLLICTPTNWLGRKSNQRTLVIWPGVKGWLIFCTCALFKSKYLIFQQ